MGFSSPRKRCFETNPSYAAFKPFVEKKFMFLPGFLGVQSLWTLQSVHLTGVGKGRAVPARGVRKGGGVGKGSTCVGCERPERPRRDLHAEATVRGCPCPVAGRSLRHPAFARSMLTALRHPACDDQSAETDRCPSNAGSRGTGSPSRMQRPEVAKRARQPTAGQDARPAPATGGRQEKTTRCRVFREVSPVGRAIAGCGNRAETVGKLHTARPRCR